MLVLGIESTCDETACAIVRDGQDILANVVTSQIDLHQEFGGVVPELACRRHIDLILPVIDQALKEANVDFSAIDLIAVAHGPGLIGALLIGLNTAKSLAFALQKPLIGVNHVEAHLYAALMSASHPVTFPCLGVVLSGGHTAIVLMKELGYYVLIGQTIDDAVGEAFDKVAKMLNLPYPGGPQIEKLALQGDAHRFPLKAGQTKENPFHFSFSGLKTAVLYTIKRHMQEHPSFSTQDAADLAASFQRVACEDIVKKTLKAAQHYQTKSILLGGGVTNNRYLRQLFEKHKQEDRQFLWPSFGLSLDNAAMIAGLGYHHYRLRGEDDLIQLEPLVRIPFQS